MGTRKTKAFQARTTRTTCDALRRLSRDSSRVGSTERRRRRRTFRKGETKRDPSRDGWDRHEGIRSARKRSRRLDGARAVPTLRASSTSVRLGCDRNTCLRVDKDACERRRSFRRLRDARPTGFDPTSPCVFRNPPFRNAGEEEENKKTRVDTRSPSLASRLRVRSSHASSPSSPDAEPTDEKGTRRSAREDVDRSAPRNRTDGRTIPLSPFATGAEASDDVPSSRRARNAPSLPRASRHARAGFGVRLAKRGCICGTRRDACPLPLPGPSIAPPPFPRWVVAIVRVDGATLPAKRHRGGRRRRDGDARTGWMGAEGISPSPSSLVARTRGRGREGSRRLRVRSSRSAFRAREGGKEGGSLRFEAGGEGRDPRRGRRRERKPTVATRFDEVRSVGVGPT